MSKLITNRRRLLKGSAAAAVGLATPTIFTSSALGRWLYERADRQLCHARL